MRTKLMKSIFFEQKKNVVIFFATFMLMSALFIIVNSVTTTELTKQESLPDFVYTGTVYQSVDGSYPFTYYNSLNGFNEYIEEAYKDTITSYGVVCRSLYNYYDELTSIGFSGRVYGVNDEMMRNKFANYLVEGRLPETGKKEAIVGYYYSKWYDVSVGDTILSTVTLNETWVDEDKNQYTVVGVLDESINSMFVGSIIISKETFEQIEGFNEDNMILGYFLSDDKEGNDKAFLNLNSVAQNYRALEGHLYANQKSHNKESVKYRFVAFALIGIVIMCLIISYFLKGTTSKIGLLKALGVSNQRIYVIFLTGYLLLLLIAMAMGLGLGNLAIYKMNKYINEFYGFDAHTYQIEAMSFLLLLSEMVVFGISIFVNVYVKTKLVQPKNAMLVSE